MSVLEQPSIGLPEPSMAPRANASVGRVGDLLPRPAVAERPKIRVGEAVRPARKLDNAASLSRLVVCRQLDLFLVAARD